MWLLLTIVLVQGVPDFEVRAQTQTMTECIRLLKQQPMDPSLHCIYAKSVDRLAR